VRDVAAATMEDEAETWRATASTWKAVSHLDPCCAMGPTATASGEDRRLSKGPEDEAAQEALLAEIPSIERRHPDEALAKSAASPRRRTSLRSSLPSANASKSSSPSSTASPPEVVLRDGYLLDYDRGRTVSLSFRVTDDYRCAT